MILRLFQKKLKNRNPVDYTNQTKSKYTNLTISITVKTNIEIVFLLNLYMIQGLLKEKLMLILLILEKLLINA